MTNEAKVGAFAVGALALLAAVLIGLSGVTLFGPRQYTLYATFPEVIGLNPDAEVRFAGVPAGRIKAVEAEGTHVLVKLAVDETIKVPHGSALTVSASGFLGEKYVNILPAKDKGVYLSDGDRVAGTPEESMEAVMGQMAELVAEAHAMLGGINEVVNNPDLKSSFVATAVNMKEITGNIRELTGSFARMSLQNEDEIRLVVQNLGAISASLSETAREVEAMTTDFSGDGEAAANLRRTVANIASTSARIDRMASSLEGVVTDPKTAEDLKATLHNVRAVSEKANRMLGGAVRPGAELMYSGKESRWRANVDVRIAPSERNFFLLGVNDIGEGNRFNLQGGRRMGALTGRAGLIDGEVGVGLDADAGSRWRFSLDAYDLNDVRLRPRASFRVAESTYVFGQMDDANRRAKRAAYIGVRQEF